MKTNSIYLFWHPVLVLDCSVASQDDWLPRSPAYSSLDFWGRLLLDYMQLGLWFFG